MQTVRLSTVIAAPVERCYRLALNNALLRDAMAPWVLEGGLVERKTLDPGETLRWSEGRGAPLDDITETIVTVRSRVYVSRSLQGRAFVRCEIEQHFAPMNDGTRLLEEIRFSLRAGWLRGLRERRVRRVLLQILTARDRAIQTAAEGDGWQQYLLEEQPRAAV